MHRPLGMTFVLAVAACSSGGSASPPASPASTYYASTTELMPAASDATASGAAVRSSTVEADAAISPTEPDPELAALWAATADPTPALSPRSDPKSLRWSRRNRTEAGSVPAPTRETATDLRVSQNVRKAVMDDNSLSFEAKNVRIVARGGKVTLRGRVNTEKERLTLEEIARRVAGSGNVVNLVEVEK